MSLESAFAPGGAPRKLQRRFAGAVDPLAEFESCLRAVESLAGERPDVFPEPCFGDVIEEVLARSERPEPVDADEGSPARRVHSGGTRRQPPGRPSPDAPKVKTVAAARSLPHRVDSPTLERRAGARPARSRSSARTQTVIGLDRRANVRRSLPVPPDSGSVIESTAAKIAVRLGNVPASSLQEVLKSVPRPGPAAPAPMLAGSIMRGRQGGTDVPRSDRSILEESPVDVDRSRGTLSAPSLPQPHHPHGSQGSSLASSDQPPAVHLGSVESIGAGDSDTSRRPGGHDVTRVRHVTSHWEFPAVPARARTSSPPGLREGFTERAETVTGGTGEDLELRMKQILDEAARRHGIEV